MVGTHEEPERVPLLKSAPGGIPIAEKPFSIKVDSGEPRFGHDTWSGPPRELSNASALYATVGLVLRLE